MLRTASVVSLVFVLLAPAVGAQQAADSALNRPTPATKLEAFSPDAGTISTLAYVDVGSVRGVSVQAREIVANSRAFARGALVRVFESQYRNERSFVDADELPELVKGIDALLDVKGNPGRLEFFETSYETKGELQITVYNMRGGRLAYGIRAGRVTTARELGLSEADLRKFRDMIATVITTLGAAP